MKSFLTFPALLPCRAAWAFSVVHLRYLIPLIFLSLSSCLVVLPVILRRHFPSLLSVVIFCGHFFHSVALASLPCKNSLSVFPAILLFQSSSPLSPLDIFSGTVRFLVILHCHSPLPSSVSFGNLPCCIVMLSCHFQSPLSFLLVPCQSPNALFCCHSLVSLSYVILPCHACVQGFRLFILSHNPFA